MDWIDAVILGLVQGVTEFLPVSSTGHLVLFRDWLVIDAAHGLAFDSILHLATATAVVVYFWSDIWVLLQALLRKLSRLPVNEKDLTLLKALIIGTIPAVLMGLLLESVIDEHFRTAGTVAVVLAVASLFFMYTEWKQYLRRGRGEITLKRGFLIGLYQVLALLPGMSRSGATIAGGMLVGMSRYEASRFSFLLAIPITVGVGVKKLLDFLAEETTVDWAMIGVGAGIAFVTALIVIHFFLQFIRRYTLWPFVWYGLVLSAMVAYVHFFTI